MTVICYRKLLTRLRRWEMPKVGDVIEAEDGGLYLWIKGAINADGNLAQLGNKDVMVLRSRSRSDWGGRFIRRGDRDRVLFNIIDEVCDEGH
jgi:hypothetical protein